MAIWKKKFSLEGLNRMNPGTMMELVGIRFTGCDDDSLTSSMPVDQRTHQPMGILHGGATVALAETVGSSAANLAVDDEHYCVGLEINCNHVRSCRDGSVHATARPLHLGGSTQVWDIRIHDQNQRLVAVSRLTMAVLRHRD